MIEFFIVMGVIFTALLISGAILWLVALIADPLDRRIWRALR